MIRTEWYSTNALTLMFAKTRFSLYKNDIAIVCMVYELITKKKRNNNNYNK